MSLFVRDYPYGTLVIGDLKVKRENVEVALKRKAHELSVVRADDEVSLSLLSPGGLPIPLRYVKRVAYPPGFDKFYISNPVGSGLFILYIGKPVGLAVEPSVTPVINAPQGITVNVPVPVPVVGGGSSRAFFASLWLGQARDNEVVAENVVYLKVVYASMDANYVFKFGSPNAPGVTLRSGDEVFGERMTVYMSNPVANLDRVDVYYVAVEV